MSELELMPAGFGLCFLAYYLRGIWRLYRSLAQGAKGLTFTEALLRLLLSPEILRDALRCALLSLGVFLGIEIAQGNRLDKDIDSDSETDHF